MRLVTATILSAMMFGAVASAAALPADPMGQLKYYNGRLDKLLRKKSDAPVDREQVKSTVGELIDFRELARRALAANWDGLQPAQRDEFVKTFSDMIEKNYVRQLRSNLDYEVAYQDEQVSGDEATITSIIKIRTKGKSTDAHIDYKMHKVGERWLVYDVVTDEVSMLKNYRQQFTKIISTDGYDALLAKMKKRIAELDGDKAAPAK